MNVRVFFVVAIFVLAITGTVFSESFDVTPSTDAATATTATSETTAPPVEIVTGSGITTLDIVLLLSGVMFLVPHNKRPLGVATPKEYATRE